MTRRLLLLPLPALALAATLAACGGGSTGTSGSDSSSPAALSVRSIDGVGQVLVDARGRALYAAREEADGRIRCAGPCTAFWSPAAPVAGRAPGGVARLGTVRRPDGTAQLTAGGRPLYTFRQDAPGKAAGNGVTDRFGSRSFTWSAVVAQGTAAAPAKPSKPPTYSSY